MCLRDDTLYCLLWVRPTGPAPVTGNLEGVLSYSFLFTLFKLMSESMKILANVFL